MYNPQITDLDILKLIDRIEKADLEDEKLSKEIIQSLLAIIVDTRVLIRKIYQNTPKKQRVYKRPTNNSNDIITGKN